MKTQNKFFSILIAIVLLTTIFVPHFVLATDAATLPELPPVPEIPAEPTEPTPILEVPAEEPAPTPDPVPTTDPVEPTPSPTTDPAIPNEPTPTPVSSIDTTAPIITLLGENPMNNTTTVAVQESRTEPLADEPIVVGSSDQGADPDPIGPDIEIRLNILTPNETILADTIIVSPCKVTPDSEPILSPYCALKGLSDRTGWNLVVNQYGFLEEFKSYAGQGFDAYWLWFHNNQLGEIAITDYVLTSGETITFTYGAFPLKVEFNPSQPVVGSTTTISVYQFGFDEQNGYLPTWSIANDSTLLISTNGIEETQTTVDGKYELVPTSPDPVWVLAHKTGFLSTVGNGFISTLPTAPIRLNIQTHNGEFFNQVITVTACRDDFNPKYTLNGWCALQQTATVNNWSLGTSSYGSDIFLNDINEYTLNWPTASWGWFSNLQYGESALNKHILSENENLLLTYGVNPIKLEVNNTDTTTTVRISELIFVDWSPQWVSLSSTTLHLNEATMELNSDTYEFVPTTTTTIFASKNGYVSSDTITVGPSAVTNNTNTEPPSNSGGNGGDTTPTNSAAVFNVNSAAEYLYSQQKSTGAIGSGTLYSDWAAMAIGSLGNSEAKTNLITYLKTNPNPGSTATDYERRAMALLALGINPYSDTATNYIAEIIKKYDGTQFGDAGLVNDDIFALFPLLKSGYSTSDVEIQKSVAFILSRQNSNGSWESPDMTAAAVQALSQVKSIAGVDEALVKAKNYLKVSTKTDGRIGDNDFSTSWGVQALSALGESIASWNGANTSPLSYLGNQQQSDGGVQPATASTDNRIWSTSYAIPAAQGKTWYSLLSTVSKPTVVTPTVIPGVDIVVPTTTLPVTTSTPSVTSTPAVIVPTTTPILVVNPEVILPTTTITTITQEPTNSTEPALALELPPLAPTDRLAPAGIQRTPATATPTIVPDSELRVLPPNTPESENKALLSSALAVAGTAGTYLAYRFIQSLV